MEKIGYCLSYMLVYNVMFATAFIVRGYEDKGARIMLAIFLVCIVVGIISTIGIVSVDDSENNEATIGKQIMIVTSENITRKKYIFNLVLMLLSGLIIFLDVDWKFLTLFWISELLYAAPYADPETVHNNPMLLILGYNVFKCTGKNVSTEEVADYRILAKKFYIASGATVKFKNINKHTLRLNKDIA